MYLGMMNFLKLKFFFNTTVIMFFVGAASTIEPVACVQAPCQSIEKLTQPSPALSPSRLPSPPPQTWPAIISQWFVSAYEDVLKLHHRDHCCIENTGQTNPHQGKLLHHRLTIDGSLRRYAGQARSLRASAATLQSSAALTRDLRESPRLPQSTRAPCGRDCRLPGG